MKSLCTGVLREKIGFFESGKPACDRARKTRLACAPRVGRVFYPPCRVFYPAHRASLMPRHATRARQMGSAGFQPATSGIPAGTCMRILQAKIRPSDDTVICGGRASLHVRMGRVEYPARRVRYPRYPMHAVRSSVRAGFVVRSNQPSAAVSRSRAKIPFVRRTASAISS